MKNKTALVLAGGFPQIELIKQLKLRGIRTVLADYYMHPVARDYADIFFGVSTLDMVAIKELAEHEEADYIITVCTDQALMTMAWVSEELSLPCFLSYETIRNVTNKSFMKSILSKCKIPTANYISTKSISDIRIDEWKYPIIVKPVDCNSSKGVRKVCNDTDLLSAFSEAQRLSRTESVIIEEFVDGEELSVDAVIVRGKAIILDITMSEKIKLKDRFIINRTLHSPFIFRYYYKVIQKIVQRIADGFGIMDAPMLVQMISTDVGLYVVEFSARTGGGVKYRSIKELTGVDIISYFVDLTMGHDVDITARVPSKYMIDEYIYCKKGVFDRADGFETLVKNEVISDYYLFRSSESVFDKLESSGDRVGGFTVIGDSLKEVYEKHSEANKAFRVLDEFGNDLARHDLAQLNEDWLIGQLGREKMK